MYELACKYFEIPGEARDFIHLFLREDEIRALELMGRSAFSEGELRELLKNVTDDAGRLISEAYSRAVFNKVETEDGLMFQAADFYKRLAYFAQYEPEKWVSIPKERRQALDEWYVREYAEKARPRLEASLSDDSDSALIENAFFLTLEETLEVIDGLQDEPYVVPCNCKSVALNCEKPREVCIVFKKDINSQWDRGHGKSLSKEEAKELIRFANRNGLMQTSETEFAICNCDSCCCYPIRASQIIGAKGLWPKKTRNVVWNGALCINCGKCVKICNFGAFSRSDEGVVRFEKDACWSCTICANYCPAGAITLERI